MLRVEFRVCCNKIEHLQPKTICRMLNVTLNFLRNNKPSSIGHILHSTRFKLIKDSTNTSARKNA